MPKLVTDFETANREGIDLTVVGAAVYAQHPATEVLCLCLWDEDGTGYVWKPGDDTDWLSGWAKDPDLIFEAHGAFFEQCVWRYIMVERFHLPDIPIDRWACTMAAAFAKGLPGGLEKAADVLELRERKDKEGSKATIALSKPQTRAEHMRRWDGTGTKAAWSREFVEGKYDRSTDTIDRVVVPYCMQDCRTEGALAAVTGPLSDYECRVWELDQKINWRGVKIDVEFVHAAQRVVAGATIPLRAEFAELTGGLDPGQVAAIKLWCQNRGVVLDSLDKETMKELGIGEEADEEVSKEGRVRLPETVGRVLQIRAMLGSSSVKKLGRMLQTLSPDDGRCRGLVQYHSAHTGRWGGRLWQPHNLPRGLVQVDGKPPKVDEIVAAIMTGSAAYVQALYGEPIAAVGTALRQAVIAEDGHALAVGDFAGIEMRVDLALAGQHDKCEILASGRDVYLDMAADIYGRTDLTKENVPERTIGKNTVLGCGFQMGAKTFHDRYCGNQTIEFAEKVVSAYRKTWAPLVPELWKGLEAAALAAVYDHGRASSHGIEYEWVEQAGHAWLACHIPDGQTMWYFDPHYIQRSMPWDEADVRPGWSYRAMKEGQWRTFHAYGGLLTENVVQKIARGLLVEAMFRCEENGFPVILTVHDEIVAEPIEALADFSAFRQIMRAPTLYSRAIGVPIEVEGYVGRRYKK